MAVLDTKQHTHFLYNVLTLGSRTFFLALALGLCTSVFAQRNAFLDTISQSFQAKPTIDFRLDNRNSFITTNFARIQGIKLGLDFNQTVKLGVGFNLLRSRIDRNLPLVNRFGNRYSTQAALNFWYFAPYFEYAFYRTHPWEISIPVQVGVGAARYRYFDEFGDRQRTDANLVVLYEPYMVCQYRFLRYFAVGAGVGYRLLFVGNGSINENLNSPIYVIKTKIFLGDIAKDLGLSIDR